MFIGNYVYDCQYFGTNTGDCPSWFLETQGSAQNSITSLLKADSIGCYGSEFDVWLTKDNGLVVSHDGIIQGHKVEESTLKELTGLWLANGECVPSLKRASGNS